MPKENELTVVTTVKNDDKIRVVDKDGLSQSIEVGHLKGSLSIDVLSGKVDTLEDKADTNDEAHTNINSRIDELELVVGDEGDGETELGYGLVKKVSDIESDLAEVSLTDINLHTTQLSEIRGRLDIIDGTNGRLDIIDGTNGRLDVLEEDVETLNDKQTTLEEDVETLNDKQTTLEEDVTNLANTKLDQSAFQNAVASGFKIIGKTPDIASAAGEPGEVCWDAQYFYVCVGTNTWKRIPLQDW